jgi:hypothetical protein
MEQVKGKDFVHPYSVTEKDKRSINEIITSISTALDVIHKRRIFVYDVNLGTFLVDNEGPTVTTRVVDFELAVTNNDFADTDKKKELVRGYALRDAGFRIMANQPGFKLTPEIAQKVEQYTIASQLLNRFLGDRIAVRKFTPELSPEDQEKYDKQLALLQPQLEKIIGDEMKNKYPQLKQGPEGHYFPNTVDEYLLTLPQHLDVTLPQMMLNITFPYFAKQSGITFNENVTRYLQDVLNPVVEERTGKPVQI